jgi:hypothetical protein
MGEIYKRASHVIACVGEYSDDSNYICEFLKSEGEPLDGKLNDVLPWRKVEALALEKARHCR